MPCQDVQLVSKNQVKQGLAKLSIIITMFILRLFTYQDITGILETRPLDAHTVAYHHKAATLVYIYKHFPMDISIHDRLLQYFLGGKGIYALPRL